MPRQGARASTASPTTRRPRRPAARRRAGAADRRSRRSARRPRRPGRRRPRRRRRPARRRRPTRSPTRSRSTRSTQSYAGAELDALRAALDQIPDAQLSVVDGLTFARRHRRPDRPEGGRRLRPEDAHGDDVRPRVHRARRRASRARARRPRTRRPARSCTRSATRSTSRRCARRGVEKDKADAAVDALTEKYPDPDDPTKSRSRPPTQEKEINATLKAQKDAETARAHGAVALRHEDRARSRPATSRT